MYIKCMSVIPKGQTYHIFTTPMAAWYAPGMAIKGSGLQIMWYICPVTVEVSDFIEIVLYVTQFLFRNWYMILKSWQWK